MSVNEGRHVCMKRPLSGWTWGVLHEVGTFVEYAQPPASGSLPSGTAGGARGSACGPRPVPLCRHLPV